METPNDRFHRRCKELEIDLDKFYYGHCDKHGQTPAVYDSNINSYACRVCTYHAIMDKAGKYHTQPVRE